MRKAASVATLGKVPWRGRTERLARASVAQTEAVAELDNASWLQRRLDAKVAAARARHREAAAVIDETYRPSRKERRRARKA